MSVVYGSFLLRKTHRVRCAARAQSEIAIYLKAFDDYLHEDGVRKAVSAGYDAEPLGHQRNVQLIAYSA